MEPLSKRSRSAEDRLAWYLKAKFGLFLHWGAYAAGGVEASWPIMTPDLAEIMFGNATRISETDYTALPGALTRAGLMREPGCVSPRKPGCAISC